MIFYSRRRIMTALRVLSLQVMRLEMKFIRASFPMNQTIAVFHIQYVCSARDMRLCEIDGAIPAVLLSTFRGNKVNSKRVDNSASA